MSDTNSRLITIIQSHTSMPVAAHSRLVPDLGLDSLDLTQLSMDIEREFSLYQFDYDPNSMETVEQVVRAIDEQVAKAQAKQEQAQPAAGQ